MLDRTIGLSCRVIFCFFAEGYCQSAADPGFAKGGGGGDGPGRVRGARVAPRLNGSLGAKTPETESFLSIFI